MFVRSPFNFDGDVVSHQTGLNCVEPSLAEQSFRDECDINVMVQRFARTGVPEAPPLPPSPADFDQVFDFQSAMQQVIDSRAAFAALPARVRDRFANDPRMFVEFFNDPANADEAVALGLAVRRPSEEPVSSPSSDDASSVVSPAKE